MISLEGMSKDERIEYFESLTLDHMNLLTAYRATIDLINNSQSGRVFLVYGPSGVGKSTLLERVKETIFYENIELMKFNKGIIPVVDFEVASEGTGRFNWKDFYRRFLKSINEPLLDEKLSKMQLINKGQKKRVPVYLPNTAQELRESLENGLIYREVKVALLDEAQHFLKIPSSKSLYDHMDALKSLANVTGTIFILFGNYELIKFLDINGQISRRTKEIYFRRYDIKNKKDWDRFQKAVLGFQDNLPFRVKFDLLEHVDFLYERSIGCIGVLKDWLLECVQVAVKRDMENISIELLKRYAPSSRKAFAMATDAIDGEKKIREMEYKSKLLREKLGMSSQMQTVSTTKNKKKGSANVGQRNAKRDKVGVDNIED